MGSVSCYYLLDGALKTSATIQVTKKSGATITGTVKSIANGHFVLKCHLGSIAIFFNSIGNIEVVKNNNLGKLI